MPFLSFNTFTVLPVSIVASFLLASCSGSDSETPVPVPEVPVVSSAVFGECGSGAPIQLPCGFPFPRESDDNPLSVEKVELGRLLFYDRNMSFNQTQSCADCHLQEKAFTDGLKVSIRSQADMHARNAIV